MQAVDEKEDIVDKPIFYTAEGTSRKCALPNFDYLYDEKYPLQRHYRVRYLYSEYVQACEEAGERPYAFSTFINKKVEWRFGRVTESRPPWHPGERLHCYWAFLPKDMEYDERGDRRSLFVAILPYSGYSFICPTKGRDLLSWMECCTKAYHFFGGIPHVTECDYSICLPVRPSGRSNSEATLLTLQAFAVHYRTVLFHPGPKTQKTASKRIKPLMSKYSSKATMYLRKRLAGSPALSFSELSTRISEIVDEFNQESDGKGPSRRELFEKQERPQLLSIPDKDYDMAVWCRRVVGSDYHIEYHKVKYSVPYQFANETVRVCVSENEVKIYCGGDLIATHVVPKKGVKNRTVTDPSHRPPAHRSFAKRLEERFMALAKEVGPATGAIMKEVLFACKEFGGSYRPCKDLLDLQNTPSGITLEEACVKVLERQLELTVASVVLVMQEGTQ